MRSLLAEELKLVTGGQDEGGNEPAPTENNVIVVTAKRIDDGGWCVGFGKLGGYAEMCVTSLDVFFGIGIGRPGFNIDFENEGDLNGFDVNPGSNAVYRIGTIEMMEGLDNLFTNVQDKLDYFAQEMTREIYGPVIQNPDGTYPREFQ